jgi:hypothetical protein
MENITNYIKAGCELTNGQVISIMLSGITLGLVLGMVAEMRRNNR